MTGHDADQPKQLRHRRAAAHQHADAMLQQRVYSQPPLVKPDLFQAGDLLTLSFLDRFDKLGGVE